MDFRKEGDDFCPNCGSDNPEGSNFCMECGENLKSPERNLGEDKGFERDRIGDQMESLNLTPAESLLILDPKADGKDMLKFTFTDLLVRKVIGIESREVEKGIIFKKPTLTHFVMRGKAFETPYLKPHEEIFRAAFSQSQKLDFKERYIPQMLRQISTFSKYRDHYLREPLTDAGYFKKVKTKIAGIIPRKTYELTDYGLDVKLKIQKLLDEEKRLDYWMEKDKERAKAFLSACGTHILLEGYDLKTLMEYSRILRHVKPKKHHYHYSLYALSDLIEMDTVLDNFDLFDLDFDLDFGEFDFDDFFDDFDAGFDVGDGNGNGGNGGD